MFEGGQCQIVNILEKKCPVAGLFIHWPIFINTLTPEENSPFLPCLLHYIRVLPIFHGMIGLGVLNGLCSYQNTHLLRTSHSLTRGSSALYNQEKRVPTPFPGRRYKSKIIFIATSLCHIFPWYKSDHSVILPVLESQPWESQCDRTPPNPEPSILFLCSLINLSHLSLCHLSIFLVEIQTSASGTINIKEKCIDFVLSPMTYFLVKLPGHWQDLFYLQKKWPDFVSYKNYFKNTKFLKT